MRLNGRTITYVAPEQRVRSGMRMLPGGKGVFPTMTVRENLEMGAFIYREDRDDMNAADRPGAGRCSRDSPSAPDRPAASLSGGQQQMLALAHDAPPRPRGAASSTSSRSGSRRSSCTSCSRSIEQLKAAGMTIVIVEQSLNVALAIADRAVFLEKGRCASRARPTSCSTATTSRAPCSSGRGRLSRRASSRWITQQLVFDGFVTGLVIGLLAMGIVLIYRSTRVINFAVGDMGSSAPRLLACMVVDYGVPFWLALIGALVVGTSYGAVVELAVIAGCSPRHA